MPSFPSFLLVLGLLYVSVFLVATTYRNARFGNERYPHPYPLRYALASAAVETFLTPPLAQHRARMKAMRDAETRRANALALSMGRHPAGHQVRSTAPAHTSSSLGETNTSAPPADEFVARVRATHVADQVTACFRAAKAMHPATRAAVAAAKAMQPATTGRSIAAG